MEIETGIPLPDRSKSVSAMMRTLEVGQSLVASETAIRIAVNRIQHASNKRFTTSSNDLERGLVRVWRTT